MCDGDNDELAVDATRSAGFKADLRGSLSDTTLGFEGISSSRARSLPFADPT